MCIRDSSGVVEELGGSWLSFLGGIRWLLRGDRRRRRLIGCCLLYTSDAADERSSVDLGGRRIIYKKHHISLSDIH